MNYFISAILIGYIYINIIIKIKKRFFVAYQAYALKIYNILL